eukprot:CAMPEP_0198134438 /NCGR_PEP_ID=MMETSP1442-20131203/60076_1 /TAXON_ID= /ORGANISM="Craspedostauros australis, Strain CCMP3328" /LENGTH=107 /DNA_ID=CAMNT_0043795581 /DNA_START=1080 /DNA_END=1403 /DNA_ORIENTATION=+
MNAASRTLFKQALHKSNAVLRPHAACMSTNMKPGTPLPGLAVFKGVDAPVVQESYPDWVADLVKPKKTLAELRKMDLMNAPLNDETLAHMHRQLKLERRAKRKAASS